jgi:hypothetical protein
MFLIVESHRKDLPYGRGAGYFYDMNVCQISIPQGLPGQGLIKSMSNIDLSKTSEQLWYSTLKHLAGSLRGQHVSCLHDKIYAFFGIAKRSLPPSLSHTDLFNVNYNQTVDALFVSFTSELFRNLPTLSPLSSSEGVGLGERNRKGLPSWCPDYSIWVPMKLVNRREQMQYGIPGFAASLPLAEDSIPSRINGRILYVTGKKLNNITEIGPTMRYSIHRMRTDSFGITGLLDMCLKMSSMYNLTGQDRLEVIWRTLIQDIDFDGGSKCEYPADHSKFSRLFSAYIALYTSVVLNELDGGKQEEYLKALEQWEGGFRSSAVFPSVSTIIEVAKMSKWVDGWLTHPLFDECNLFCVRASPCSSGRKLFITSERWLGLGPPFLEPNDELWLLKHAAVPFILRPYGASQYQLVGEAYVHGIMHGELVAVPGGMEGFREIEIV